LKTADWRKLASRMQGPRLIFDTRNVLADASDTIQASGLT
jgi:hypothetical protein